MSNDNPVARVDQFDWGEIQWLTTYDELCLRRCGVALCKIYARKTIPVHMHLRVKQVLYVTSGTAVQIINQSEQMLVPGCLVRLSEDIQHAMMNRSVEYFEFLTLYFPSDAKDIQHLVDSMRATEEHRPSVCARKGVRDVVERAKAYIDANLSQEISLGRLAEKLYVSPFYLSRLFKIETNQSFKEYLNQKRVGKAMDLLIRTNLTVSEIASLVGYQYPNYFARVFRKFTGQSPDAFRKARKRAN